MPIIANAESELNALCSIRGYVMFGIEDTHTHTHKEEAGSVFEKERKKEYNMR